MGMLISTLPGDIPGLLRSGSPVCDFRSLPGVVVLAHGTTVYVGMPVAYRLVSFWCGSLWLNLADPTGRAHAAWWTFQQRDPQEGWTGFPPPISVEEGMARRLARTGADMSPEQIDVLARLVLRLARREGC